MKLPADILALRPADSSRPSKPKLPPEALAGLQNPRYSPIILNPPRAVPAKMAEIQRVSPTHESMMDWMLLNPGATLAQMGAHFGYSVAWLSQVINSDLFQAKYRERRGEIDSRVAMDIPARMRGIAAQALDKLADHIAKSEQPEFILETTDKVLHRLGYAPSKGPAATATNVTNNVTNNVLITDPAALAAAREKMAQLGTSVLPAIPANAAPLPLPAEVCAPSAAPFTLEAQSK